MGAITNPEAEIIIEALVRAGADPFQRDEHGMTFYDFAESVQREHEGTDFAEKVRRCVDVARTAAPHGRLVPP